MNNIIANINKKALDDKTKHFKLKQARLKHDTFVFNVWKLKVRLLDIKNVIVELIEHYNNKYGYNKAKYINVDLQNLTSETYISLLNLIDIELTKPMIEFESTYYIFDSVYKSEQILYYIDDYSENYALEMFPTLFDIKLAFSNHKYKYRNRE